MIFKNINLNTFDAILLSKGQRRKADKVYYEYGKLPASSVTLYEDTGTYGTYERQLQILSKDETELDELYLWLDGAGDLEGLETGLKYKARVLTVDPVTESLELGWTRITVTFEIQPFAYLATQNLPLTNGQTVTNPHLPVYPYLKITGSGNVILTISGKQYRINNISEYIEINYPFAYKGVTPKGRDLLDGFPVLNTGANVISWSGTVTKVEAGLTWKTL